MGETLRALRRRFFKLVAILTVVVVLLLGAVAFYVFDRDRIHDFARMGLAEVFDTEVTTIEFDKAGIDYSWPDLNGRGYVSISNFRVRSVDDTYNVINLPKLVVRYDLFSLLKRPLTRIEIPDGVSVAMLLDDEGNWADAAILKPQEDESETPDLDLEPPEIIIRNAWVHYRVPVELADPDPDSRVAGMVFRDAQGTPDAVRFQGKPVQKFSNLNLSLLRSRENPNTMLLRGESQCEFWGRTVIHGSITKELELDVRIIKQDMLLDDAFFARTGPKSNAQKIRNLLLPNDAAGENRLDLTVRISGGGERPIDVDVNTYYEGNILYRNVPGLVQHCHAQVNYNLASGDLTIVNGAGLRGAGRIYCDGIVRSVGTNNEEVQVNVRARGVAVSQHLRETLKGVVGEDGTRTYPDFQRYGRPDAGQPNVPIPFDLISRMCLPTGYADAEVTVINRYQGGTDVDIYATVLDLTASYMGTPSTTASYMSDTALTDLADHRPGLRSLERLTSQQGLPQSAPSVSPPFTSFPMTVYNLRGVVEGSVRADAAPLFRVRGFSQDEVEFLNRVHPSMAGSFRVEQPDAPGITGHRGDGQQRVFMAANEIKLGSPRDAEGVDTSRVQIQVKTEGFQLDPTITRMLPSKVQEVLKQLSPDGSVDVDRGEIVIQSVLTEPAVTLNFNFAPRGMTAGFTLPGATQPIPLENVQGSITQVSVISPQENRHEVRISRAEAEVSDDLGGGGVRMNSFNLETDRPREHIYFDLEAQGLKFDESLFAYLPESVKQVQDLFAPAPLEGTTRALAGEISVKVRFGIWPGKRRRGEEMRDHPGASEVLEVRMKLSKGRFALKTFAPDAPYHLRDVEAELVVLLRDDEGVEIQIRKLTGVPEDADLLSDNPKGRISATGSVVIPPARLGQPLLLDMHVEAKNVLAGPKLRDSVDNFLGKDNPVGKFWKQLEAEPDQSLGRIDVDADLRGWIPLGGKAGSGSNQADAEADANQPATTGNGEASVEADQPEAPKARFEYLAEIHLHHGTVTYDLMRLPLTDVEGTLSIRTGPVVEFRDFKAKAPEGTLELTRVEVVDGVLDVSVSARGIPFNEQLREAVEGIEGISKVIELLDPLPNPELQEAGKPTGLMNLEASIRVAGPRIDIRQRLEVIATDLTIGVRFEKVTGVWETENVLINGGEDGEDQQYITGDVNFAEVEWKGLKFTDISSRIENDSEVMTLPNVRGTLYGGTIRGNFFLRLGELDPDERAYQGTFVAENVALADAARALGGTQGEEEDVSLTGGMSGELIFHPLDPDTGMIGRGRLDIGRQPLTKDQLARFNSLSEEERRGKLAELGKVPLFSGVYEALGLSAGEYFNEAHMVFHLLPDRLKIRQMEFVSNFIRVQSEGGVDTDQQDLNPYSGTGYMSGQIAQDTNYILYAEDDGEQLALTLVPSLFPRAPNVPGLKYLWDPIKGTVFKIYVGGTFTAPSVEPFTRNRDPEAENKAEVYPDYSPVED